MKKITLGHSTLNVTAEGYGCMGLSEFYGLTSEIDAERMLERVIEKVDLPLYFQTSVIT